MSKIIFLKIILIYFKIKNISNQARYSTFKYLPTLIFLLCQRQEKREKVCLPKVEKIQDHGDIIRMLRTTYGDFQSRITDYSLRLQNARHSFQ
jgi:hypothetical protein